jgi:WD40 repeat protein
LKNLEYGYFPDFAVHSAGVNYVSFSPDGRYLASASSDNTVILWSMESQKMMKMLQGHYDRVNSVVFSVDSKILVSCSNDTTIRLWNV